MYATDAFFRFKPLEILSPTMCQHSCVPAPSITPYCVQQLVISKENVYVEVGGKVAPVKEKELQGHFFQLLRSPVARRLPRLYSTVRLKDWLYGENKLFKILALRGLLNLVRHREMVKGPLTIDK